MRWEALFADLEAQLEAEAAREKTTEIQEAVRVERARETLMHRLAPQLNAHVEVRLLGGERLAGELTALGMDWFMLRHGATEELIPLGALGSWLQRTPGQRADARATRAGLGQALRALVRDRALVNVGGLDGRLLASGTLDQAGQDFLEIAVHARDEYRRRSAVYGHVLVPMASVAWVRRGG